MFKDIEAINSYMTNKIIDNMKGRTSLERHEVELMNCLLKVHDKFDPAI